MHSTRCVVLSISRPRWIFPLIICTSFLPTCLLLLIVTIDIVAQGSVSIEIEISVIEICQLGHNTVVTRRSTHNHNSSSSSSGLFLFVPCFWPWPSPPPRERTAHFFTSKMNLSPSPPPISAHQGGHPWVEGSTNLAFPHPLIFVFVVMQKAHCHYMKAKAKNTATMVVVEST